MRILVLFFLMAGLAGIAQPTRYRMEIFGTRNGLLSSKVFALAQAQNHLLWVGTEFGASAYDGYAFTNYQYSLANEPLGRILCITEDSLHGIWLGGDKGLFLIRDGKPVQIRLNGQPPLAVEALHTDALGNVWVGGINALLKLAPPIIKKVHANPADSIVLPPFAGFAKRVYGLAEDHRNNLYIASYEGIFSIPANTGHYQTVWQNPDPQNYIRSVAATSPDSVYWTNIEGRPGQLIKGKEHIFYERNFVASKVFINKRRVYTLTSDGVATVGSSIVPLVSFGQQANNAVATLIDAEGNIWIGTWEGLHKFQQSSFRQYMLQHPAHKEAFSFLETKKGELLFGGNKGMVFVKNEAGIVPLANMPPLFKNAEVLCVYEDGMGGLWAGSGYQGISRLKDGRLSNWRDTGFLKDNNCEALFALANGKMFACTEQGVTLVNPAASQPMEAHYTFQKKYARYPELFGCFETDGTGETNPGGKSSSYWFYGSQGIYALRNGQLEEDAIVGLAIPRIYIAKMAGDKKGNIWVATLGKGLLQCRYQNGRLVLEKEFDTKAGTPSDIALSVLVDKNDNVWWGDYMSISRLAYVGGSWQMTGFNENDGLLASYYQTLKLEQQQDGTIWGLTSMGVVSFHPDSISSNWLLPKLTLGSITVAGTGDNYADAVRPVFAYNQNSLQFHFTAICLTDPSKVRYAYRIREIDSNWIYTTSRMAAFNFLPPEEYTFELKACNNNNIWTEPLQYHFSINPPFWKTWWFKVLFSVLLTVLLLVIFSRRVVAIKHKAAIKQQMAELEAKAIRAQMNPHFIFNSLNAIQECILLNDFDTSYQYLSKFSKLLRQVLNNSEKNLIPLRDEIDMNRLYLELESLRFKHSFSYSITVDDAIDADMVLFPSLMLQPFIENAIWHGLMQKEGDKKLAVSFTLQAGMVQCVIADNGIGREKAGQIKKQKLGARHFESRGTQLAIQRMHLLQQSGAPAASLAIEDVRSSDGLPAGTIVIIKVPLLWVR